jgi:hypothetical protein
MGVKGIEAQLSFKSLKVGEVESPARSEGRKGQHNNGVYYPTQCN